jgi:tight adherence protein B
MILKLAVFGLTFSSVGILVWQFCPLVSDRVSLYQAKTVKDSAQRLDNMFIRVPSKKLFLVHSLSPLALGGLGFLFTGQMFIALIAGVFGLVLPTVIIKQLDAKRRDKFQGQIVDALMILVSSLKGGLSLLQSIEAMVEEMPPPISQEFALVLRENRLGIPLNESLGKLNRHMAIEELNLIVTAISVARETGGNLPKIFSQLIHTIREKSKIMRKVRTLTTQGRLQGIIMCLLPIGFIILVFTLNPSFFDIMLENDTGRFLLGYAVISQIIGMLIITKFSKVEV